MACVVRRLTPTECERLQGFPDGWTDLGPSEPVERIDWGRCPDEVEDPEGYAEFMRNPVMETVRPTPDTPRYKALGNSMAVPCMRWIGERIQMVDEITNQRERTGNEE